MSSESGLLPQRPRLMLAVHCQGSVYGNSRFGSGYPYGAGGSFVDGRALPFFFFPIPLELNYYGGNEVRHLRHMIYASKETADWLCSQYLYVNDTERPGGNLTAAIIQPSFNASSITYRIVGDNASVTAVYAALVANCSVANSTSALYTFWPNATTYPFPEQAVQYYRASSFALTLDSYNNSAALAANMPASNTTASLPLSDDSPLPAGLNGTFLECINSTIGGSVPLADPPAGRHFSSDQIFGISLAAIAASLICAYLVVRIRSCCR